MGFSTVSCEEFVSELASAAPVPGGGGASALVGALGTALGNMVGSLTVGKKKYADVEDEIRQLKTRCDLLQKDFLLLIEKDAEVFEPLSKAYALPKDDPDRKTKLREASLRACEAPLEMLRCCGETAQVLQELRERVSPLLLSDVGCAAALCRGALEAAAMNVWVNTRSFPEDPAARALNEEVSRILDAALPAAEEVTAAVREKLQN